jgi:hypothetical protein
MAQQFGRLSKRTGSLSVQAHNHTRAPLRRDGTRSRKNAALLVMGVLALAGCAGTSDQPLNPPPRAAGIVGAGATVPVETFVGRWGVASYREEKDRPRTENQARAACRNPYVIAKGPTDGVMMHVADDAQRYELTTKTGADGKNYIGFESPPGDPQDREILSFSNNLITMRFVDPDANTRYGTFIFVRCGAGR